jgi:hydroxyacylglutathione hydrolase
MLSKQPPLFEYSQGNYNIACIVTGGEWKQNTYVVTHVPSSTTIIVDPGENAAFIISYIQNSGGSVTRILLTHPHHDHIGALTEVSEYFNVVCELHKQDARLLVHAPMYALRFSNKKMAPVSRFQLFEEQSFGTGEPVVRSIHTPGHTKGSVCYLFDGFVFTGDTLLHKLVGRTDLPGSNPKELSGSIEKLLSELSDEITIFPGHGKFWTIGMAKEWWKNLQQAPPAHNTFHNLVR